jgi:outer membrane cobalamin receptor
LHRESGRSSAVNEVRYLFDFYSNYTYLFREWLIEHGISLHYPLNLNFSSKFSYDDWSVSIYKGQKIASLYQLYSEYGDSSLVSESSYNVEIGRLFANLIRATVFASFYKDLIEFNYTTSKYQNLKSSNYHGIELNFLSQYLEINYTHITHRPLRVAADRLVVNINNNYHGFYFKIQGVAVGQRNDFSGPLAGYFLLNSILAYRDFTLQLGNILNKDYTEIQGFASKGFNFWLLYAHEF